MGMLQKQSIKTEYTPQLEGYIPKFGVTAVDRDNGNKRHPKKSSAFLKRFFESAVKA
jgi:beta-glucosidase/6-phospho-beta-glucosidase/beta-galactosidase